MQHPGIHPTSWKRMEGCLFLEDRRERGFPGVRPPDETFPNGRMDEWIIDV